MITKERIDELIQQRAKVWGVGKQGNVFCVGLKFRPETLKSPKWLENKYEYYGKFFETKAEAEWHAEFEDFMEEQGFEDLEELKINTEYLKDKIKTDKFNYKQLHKFKNHLQQENEELKVRWEKLKEYIEKSIEADNKYLKSFPNNMNFENYRTTKRVILDTMKELEK